MIHALFPEVNISIRAIRGSRRTNTVFAVGKSVFNRMSRTNMGELVPNTAAAVMRRPARATPITTRRREFSKRLSGRSTRMAESQE